MSPGEFLGGKKSDENPGEKASFLPRVSFAFQTVLRTVRQRAALAAQERLQALP